MRILQLIDSLETGGAERMAVHYANALLAHAEVSALVATRKEGLLRQQLHPKVSYSCLHKQGATDRKAFWKLRSFVRQHQITHIQAHSTSFFWAVLLKCTLPKLILIRHDHYGKAEFLANRPKKTLQLTAPFFKGVIVVNQLLKDWTLEYLKAKNVVYLPNFVSHSSETTAKTTQLLGVEGKRILLLANLREQKNHLLLLTVAEKLKKTHPDWTWHLVGKDFGDDYAREIKSKIQEKHLQNQVFLYGAQSDIEHILQQSTIGVLTSVSEGLPVAVLEYGQQQLPIVVTAVGELPAMLTHNSNALLVPSEDSVGFYEALSGLILEESKRNELGKALHETIKQHYSSEGVLQKYVQWLAQL